MMNNFLKNLPPIKPHEYGILGIFVIFILVILFMNFSRNFQAVTVEMKDFEIEHVKFVEYKPDAEKQGLCFAFIGYKKPSEWLSTSNIMMTSVPCDNATVQAGIKK
ncbi:MAG: hypothetical protein J0L77_05600 [Alphaproteobacteria bacterium]|nr:hypothetical protein [Alphaproteobacteria bacterium]